jgi:hypothetical protein
MKVYNRHHGNAPADAVYIGRGTPWGNPFVMGVDGNRNEVCNKYLVSLLENPLLVARIKRELRGKDLVCSCKPRQCHGDDLLDIANS